ncbi:carbohydrate ABC transporter permease [Paenibacillus sp. GCM10027626]|uniref:carbohydrate ABC transporter permease n=1 Tax=Paenibacillus sp. GCM10027626 TaxID=3273411 RepID=UPI00362E48C3
MKRTAGETLFMWINYIILALLGLLTLYPFLYVLSASLSSPQAVVSGKVLLWPQDVTWHAYERVLTEPGIWLAYANTVYYAVAGTAVSLLLTVLGAYPLSKKRVMGRTVISFMIAFTMWFNAGMIPFYLNMRDLQLLDSRTGIIIGFAITTFLVFIMRTFFQSIPEELEESAKVDGASDWTTLWRIYMPLSKPALATVGLFYLVSRWNGYFWAMILLRDSDKIPLQVLLKKLIVEMNLSETMISSADISGSFTQETIIYATIVVAIVPMVLVYPFIQRFFTKGALIGSVKG